MVHIIVARYKESVAWLLSLLETHSNFRATIYNDGDSLNIPSNLSERIKVKSGDHVPCEPTKYTSYIIENYDVLEDFETFVFLQADPIYHNPFLLECFKYISSWNKTYQNLSLYGHPPPWGCASAILAGNTPNITEFGSNAKVWHDHMASDIQGLYFKDPFWDSFHPRVPNVNVDYMLSYLQLNNQIRPVYEKCFAACFATTGARIKGIPLTVWQTLDLFVKEGCPLTQHLSQKDRAIICEYIWAPILKQV
jgi:hypothetical protein